ncbi:hypothetical protein NB640_02555 [Oxalobacter vibrioformis]|uniref:Uncharacterized protein n=1 Tax=Oxalobacter vibrioformis TaxID=933080 RepID=A0A9E9P329_9BURK|nr:hypothetical protein [Oxalobacter vibrioformis]WAW10559.1 hypothetical protein NB640_02555 [Oxalobacter vibrioformis]
MKICRYLAVVFLSMMAAGALAEDMVDMYPGTLVISQGLPVLIRCDLVKNAYILADADMQAAPYIEQIRQLGASLESPVCAIVVGSYKNIEGKNHLVVQSIEEIQKGRSCHLMPPREPLNIRFE